MIKLIVLALLFLLESFCVNGQDTIFFDYDRNQVSSMAHAEYFSIVVYESENKNRAIETSYFKSGKIKSQINYSDYKNKISDGKQRVWNGKGQLREDIDYKENKIHGKLLTYWDNGNPKRIENYKNGKLIDGKCFSSVGEDTIYYNFETMPEYPGGEIKLIKYLRNEIKYPLLSMEKGIEGQVVVRFKIGKSGAVSNVEITNSVNNELDREAMRVVSNMPDWKPGIHDGEPVDVTYTLPIKFTLMNNR
jgi:periplasmic protein TonB